MTTSTQTPAAPGASVSRSALAGALGLAAIFAICWIGAVFAPDLPHRYIRLFTSEPATSVLALTEGMGFSVAFGATAGAIFASLYNLFAHVDRR